MAAERLKGKECVVRDPGCHGQIERKTMERRKLRNPKIVLTTKAKSEIKSKQDAEVISQWLIVTKLC